MRYWVYTLFSASLFAQSGQTSQTTVYTFDTNGRRQVDSLSERNGGFQTRVQTLNGRVAPTEKIEDRVVREDSSGRTTERIIRPYDATGNPLPPRRVLTTERKNSDGTRETETQVFQGNLNGGFSLSERSVAVEQIRGSQTVREAQVSRPTINGQLEVVERLSSTQTKSGDTSTEDALTYRKDTSGSYYVAVREQKSTTTQGNRVSESTVTYLAGSGRALELSGQTVSETTKSANGAESKQVSIYGTASPGRPAGGQPVLREQQLIEKSKTPAGTVETLSIRRPAVDNPNVLSQAQKISEKVCTGACQ